jgi:uncharacterized protein YkwD
MNVMKIFKLSVTVAVLVNHLIASNASDINNWMTCAKDVDTCVDNWTCCVAPADCISGKTTCRPGGDECSSCTSPGSELYVNNWMTCSKDVDICMDNWACCVAPADCTSGKTTCRPGGNECSSCTSSGTDLSYPGNAYRQPLSSGDIDEILDAHNVHRAYHGASPLQWSANLFSQMNSLWDNKDVFDHTQSGSGENLFFLSGGNPSFRQAIDSWYNEVSRYDFNNPELSNENGHFTQLVWKGSSTVACQKNYIPSGSYIIICQYDPPGNYNGALKENIGVGGSRKLRGFI